jgi:hypothetical protein
MMGMSVIERLRHDAEAYAVVERRASLASFLYALEETAHAIGRRAPELTTETNAILALAGEVRDSLPTRDDVVEAIEDVCGDDLSGSCVSRIADAVAKLTTGRKGDL